MAAVYVNSTVPVIAAFPFPATFTTTGYVPTGPLPTEHVMLVLVAAVTVHCTPAMVTVFSEVTVLNPVPAITIDVLKAEVPRSKKKTLHLIS